MEKRLDSNYTRMQRAIFNKSWRQHPTKQQQLYGYLPLITKTIQGRRTTLAGHCWRSWDEIISDVLLWTPSHGRAKAGRLARTYIQQLCEHTGCSLGTYRKQWTIGRGGERASGISVLMARQDDDDSIQHYSFVCTQLNGSKYCYVWLIIQFNISLLSIKWSNSSISNNSLKQKPFVCTQFEYQTFLFDR